MLGCVSVYIQMRGDILSQMEYDVNKTQSLARLAKGGRELIFVKNPIGRYGGIGDVGNATQSFPTPVRRVSGRPRYPGPDRRFVSWRRSLIS